ncbi:hypothetical protein VNO78_20438 [Psophocarpus tetragonolobus]|uniref:Uncharacterized protein n=1 Tax=Psophocarpus tetragonolobus TaxID=3891 RepID=A0AAN9S9U1_PSOTE
MVIPLAYLSMSSLHDNQFLKGSRPAFTLRMAIRETQLVYTDFHVPYEDVIKLKSHPLHVFNSYKPHKPKSLSFSVHFVWNDHLLYDPIALKHLPLSLALKSYGKWVKKNEEIISLHAL